MSHHRDPAFITIDSEAANTRGDEDGASPQSDVHSVRPVATSGPGASAAPGPGDRIAELERLISEKNDLIEELLGRNEVLRLEIRDLAANRCDLVSQRASRLLGGMAPPNLKHTAEALERALEGVRRLEEWKHRCEHALANQQGGE